MKEQIQQLLERELKKLDDLSRTLPEPLSINDVRSLDSLIKAYRSFTSETPTTPTDSPSVGDPSRLDTTDLINGITEQAS